MLAFLDGGQQRSILGTLSAWLLRELTVLSGIVNVTAVSGSVVLDVVGDTVIGGAVVLECGVEGVQRCHRSWQQDLCKSVQSCRFERWPRELRWSRISKTQSM